MKNILVTGAAGFIGSNLAEHLLKEGNLVYGVDNFITGPTKNINALKGNPNFNFLEADIVDMGSDQKRILAGQKFDEIYHLACPTGVPNLVTLAEEMLLTCSIGTRNILEIARESGAKFLFTSSSEVYGDPLEFPQKEEYTGNVHPTGIRSPYEEGKRLAEALVVMYQRKYGLDGRIVRVFNTYGSNMSEMDERIIPKFIQQIKNGTSLTVHGDGIQKRTYCHVDDLLDGLLIIMEKGGRGEVYNLGGDEEIEAKDLAELLLKISNSHVGIKHTERPAHDHQSRHPDLNKIKALGWSPKIGLDKGLRSILNNQPIEIT